MPSSATVLEQSLDPHDDRAPHRARRLLEAETHEVDRPAVIRRACQARASGAIPVVSPRWTGVIGGAVARQALQEPAIAGAH